MQFWLIADHVDDLPDFCRHHHVHSLEKHVPANNNAPTIVDRYLVTPLQSLQLPSGSDGQPQEV